MSSLSIMSKRIKIHQYQAEIGNVDEENVVIFRDVTFKDNLFLNYGMKKVSSSKNLKFGALYFKSI